MTKKKNIETSPFRKGSKGKSYGQSGIQGKIDEAYKGFTDIDYDTNLFEGAENQYADLEAQKFTNQYEDLTVAQGAADIKREDLRQQQQDTLSAYQQGGSFSAGNIQQMQNALTKGTAGISADIEQQETANQKLMAQGAAEAERMTKQSEAAVDLQKATGAADIQKLQLQGKSDALNRELQVQQGKLSFLSGQLSAANANEDADFRKGQNFWGSDRRLKKNINLIGKSLSGLNIYSFEYKNPIYGQGLFQGVMSDEITQEAVINNGEYDMVNYDMLDVEFKQI
tara:strand:- start:70 stop:918 length:849 start_codon:yes stop_codon:yes gene_type:complete